MTFDRYTPLVYAISSAFGIYSEWQEYTVNGKTQVLYYMNAPGYADYVNYMHDLYSRGWIDQQVATNSASDAVTCFVNGFKSDSTTSKAAAVACSLWSVPSIVTSMQSNGVINGTEASGTLDNYLVYLRALKNQNGEEKVYRASGYAYISAIPFYMAENAGYVLDWVNSKIKDTEEAHNFRSIVLGEEGTHWTYSPSQGYLPSENFSEKDDASYYLTGSNETVYTQYWLARVRKQAELYRAWSTLMQNADAVGVYNIVDFTPPLEDYNSNRSYMEEYAQDQFFIMLKEGTDNMQEYLTKLNSQQGGDKATKAINDWYSSYNR